MNRLEMSAELHVLYKRIVEMFGLYCDGLLYPEMEQEFFDCVARFNKLYYCLGLKDKN